MDSIFSFKSWFSLEITVKERQCKIFNLDLRIHLKNSNNIDQEIMLVCFFVCLVLVLWFLIDLQKLTFTLQLYLSLYLNGAFVQDLVKITVYGEREKLSFFPWLPH